MASKEEEISLESDEKARRKHGMLRMYYGITPEKDGRTSVDPCDINGAHFVPDVYLNRLLKEKNLGELFDKESEMVKHIRSLDSEMQTLVYENYNKFISATDTIRKMKNDFKKMEDEMDHLATNMDAITDFSAKISNTLQDRRQQITKLAGVHTLLKKLQFLFELPARLKKCIEMESYSQAVRYYTKARKVLDQYQHMPSFQGIQHDSNAIVGELKTKLRQKFSDKESTPKQLAECVDLLLQLEEPAEQLCEEFLSHARQKLDEDLDCLHKQLLLQSGQISPKDDQTAEKRPSDVYINVPIDILEFVDLGSNRFLSNLCLVIAVYNDLFLNKSSDDETSENIVLMKLITFTKALTEDYFKLVQQRVKLEKDTGDNTILVRALDRFHRRLHAMNQLLPNTDLSHVAMEIVAGAAKDRVSHYLQQLKQHFADCLTDIRQTLAAPKTVKQDGGSTSLLDLLNSTHTSIVDQIKSVLANLQAFIATDITFAMKPYFRGQFCVEDVREGLVVTFLQHIFNTCQDFCEMTNDKSTTAPSLLLITARLCSDLDTSTIGYLITLTDEKFLSITDSCGLTPVSHLSNQAKETAQKLLNHYVKVQGLIISQMLRKSVETRDWLNTIEPRNVRAVMKRVVEDTTVIDSQVGQLYEEGLRKERSSDSSRRTIPYSNTRQTQRSNWSFTPSTIDNSLMSNIQKLFSEKIEIFSAVEFSKVSVLTGIIKISLKTFLECVRLRTFGKYGLQQIQVDTHYLQLYLWRFVSDENLVHFLLDEIVGSTIHRCMDATPMEQSVIDLICERG